MQIEARLSGPCIRSVGPGQCQRKQASTDLLTLTRQHILPKEHLSGSSTSELIWLLRQKRGSKDHLTPSHCGTIPLGDCNSVRRAESLAIIACSVFTERNYSPMEPTTDTAFQNATTTQPTTETAGAFPPQIPPPIVRALPNTARIVNNPRHIHSHISRSTSCVLPHWQSVARGCAIHGTLDLPGVLTALHVVLGHDMRVQTFTTRLFNDLEVWTLQKRMLSRIFPVSMLVPHLDYHL